MSLESFRVQPLRLDHIDAHIPDRLIAHELDSAGRILRVQLTDGGDVRDTSGTSLSLAWKHQRGASGLEPFSVVDAATGVYEVTYPSAMMLDGVATCSIQVADADSLAATRNFHVRIQDAPIDGDTTASTETWTALQLILTQGQAAVTALEEQHTEHATAHDDQMQQQASEFSTAQSTRADEFTDALTDYQAQVDAAAASAIEVYIGADTPPENAVLWIDTTDGGKRVKSLVDGVWVYADAGIEATGTTGGWSWIKYTDGRAEASIEGTQTFAHTTQSGSMYLDLNTNRYPFDIALPSGVFVGNPRPLGNCMGSTSTFLNLIATTTAVNMYTAAFSSRPENNVKYNIKIEGRWK